MNTTALLAFTAIVTLPVTLTVSAAEPAEDLNAAAKKLSDQPNYSWTTKTEGLSNTNRASRGDGQGQGGQGGQGQGRGRGGFGGGFGFGNGTTAGRTEKDGFTVVNFTFGENKSEGVRKGEKSAVLIEDEWKTSDELAADG